MPTETILERHTATDQPVAATRPPVLVIVGPTGSGKTSLAIALANHLPIEIVNADSRAFYRGMDVGTAKPGLDDRERVSHHLIDIMEPDEPMSVSRFQHLAHGAIGAIHARRHIPVVVGGTPQYVNALVEGWQMPQVPPNHPRRLELEREAESIGVAPLLARLAAIDPEAAARTGPNLRRIIRALEVHEATGVPFSRLRGKADVPFRALEFELWLPREILYARIDERVDHMIEAGLVAEVQALLAKGYDPSLPAFSAIGYRQLMPTVATGSDSGQAIDRIKLDTHRFVRHQQTWFRRNPRLVRIDMTNPGALDRVIELGSGYCLPFLNHGHPGDAGTV